MSLHWRYELWWGIIFTCIYLHPMLLSFPKTADSLFLCLQAFNWIITFPFSLVMSLSLLRHICIWLKFYYLWFSCLLFFFFSYEYLVINDKFMNCFCQISSTGDVPFFLLLLLWWMKWYRVFSSKLFKLLYEISFS